MASSFLSRTGQLYDINQLVQDTFGSLSPPKDPGTSTVCFVFPEAQLCARQVTYLESLYCAKFGGNSGT